MVEKRRRKRGETRGQLMEAALTLVGKGRHFASLGIREVTREAGVVPTSFYRHFRNMDDLGLQLVDELGLVMRKLMRESRQQAPFADKLIQDSVNLFVDHVLNNRNFFTFMAQGLAGESRAVRDGISGEMRFMAHEMMLDFRRMKMAEHLSDSDLYRVCELVIRTVAFSLNDILGTSADDEHQLNTIREREIQHVKMIMLGAMAWKSEDR
ncbi:MAG: TetR family transcriptional regulator [Halomonadaceae bacterium]|nr:MAG: TetR family transcriptional regulator [Halomonadaceae bacterium]